MDSSSKVVANAMKEPDPPHKNSLAQITQGKTLLIT